ncbi:MAG: type II secretion system F family protein [Flavobacteriaceae bacterium]
MIEGQISSLAIAFMVFVAIGGVAWVFVYPLFSGERKAAKRVKSVAAKELPTRAVRQRANEADKRRKQLQTTLSDLEAKQRAANKPPLRVRLLQAGVKWTPRTYYIMSACLALVGMFVGLVLQLPFYVIFLFGFAFGLGIPAWLLKFLKARRQRKFLDEFASAVDVIVRGIKAGLPVNDCFRVIAKESQEPVRSEFRRIIETQALGLTLAECVAKMYERMPLPEANFFSIVITIQQQSGGNLAEALTNLSTVLRGRKKMKAKIRAVSQEAKASAAIIGALPLIVMLLVSITSPDYISLLWTERLGHMMLAGSAVWMTIGVLVMRKMINFEI